MNVEERDMLLRRILMTAWAMATIVLVLCVALLAWQIGQDRAARGDVASGSELAAAPAASPTMPGRSTAEVALYFADADGALLVPETRRIEFGESTLGNCRRALNALIDGPRDMLTPIMANTTKVRGLYLLPNGELTIDFSRELEIGHKKSAAAEALFAYGVVATVTQRALQTNDGVAIHSVRFLLEGSPPGDSFPAHMDWSEPIVPNPEWIHDQQGTPGNA